MDKFEALEKLVAFERKKYRPGRRFWWPVDLIELDPGMEQLVKEGLVTKHTLLPLYDDFKCPDEEYVVYTLTSEGIEAYNHQLLKI